MNKMKLSVFLTLHVFMLMCLLSGPVSAEMVEWYGALLDPSEISQGMLPESAAQVEISADPNWGTNSDIALVLDACDAFSRYNSHTYEATNCTLIRPISTESSTAIAFPVHLPSGALLHAVRIYFYDNTISTDISAGLYSKDSYGSASFIAGLTPPSFSGGDSNYTASGLSITIDNKPATGNTYYVLAILHGTPTTYEGIYRISFWYKLQVSPDPAYASFSDVPVGHWAHQYVEALYASGITAGYADGTFRPGEPVLRGQMATFLSKALGLHWPY